MTEAGMTCPLCGSDQQSGSTRCSACGAAISPAATISPGAEALAATAVTTKQQATKDTLVGRNCPYCRFPLKASSEFAECPVCHAVHHADCYAENGGCAIVGCAGDDTTAAVPHAPTPLTAPQRPTVVMPPGSMSPAELDQAPPRRSSVAHRHRRLLTSLAAALAALGCAAAAVFAASSGHTRTTTQSVPTDPQPSATTPPPETPTTPSDSGSPGSAPPVTDGNGTQLAPSSTTDDDATIQAAAQSKIADFHQAVASDDTSTAWHDLAPYNRANKISEAGYGDGTQDSPPQQWVTDMSTFNGNLDASNVQVSLVSVDRQSGIALVDVEGMTSSGGGLCNPYAGKTWMAYEDGQWWYDPGVKHHPERSSEFPNQQGLLGIC